MTTDLKLIYLHEILLLNELHYQIYILRKYFEQNFHLVLSISNTTLASSNYAYAYISDPTTLVHVTCSVHFNFTSSTQELE